MYFWALSELNTLELPPERELAALRLANQTLVRCHQGQALDLATRIADLHVGEVGAVVAATTQLKTGALCRFAAELGAIAAGADETVRTAIGQFGERMGCALQMLDDLGSLTSPARHEKAHEDLRGGRPTWPWAWLAEHGPFAFTRLANMSRAVVAGTGNVDELGAALVCAIGNTGRDRVRAALDAALADLVGTVGSNAVTQMIASELARMEQSYG
jgi:geranylgeranyl pyrophosphate synthase